MNRLIYIVAVILSLSAFGQDSYTSNNNGDWINPFIWDGPIFQVPGDNDTAQILVSDTISLTDYRECYDLTVEGALDVTTNDTLDILHDLTVTDGAIIIEEGCVNVAGDFYYDGDIESTSLNSGFIDVTGDIIEAGSTRIQTNDGAIRIYSELDFP